MSMIEEMKDASPAQESPASEPARAEPAVKGRWGVIESLYFQSPGDDPLSVDHRFGGQVETDEQPYMRKKKVGENWEPLDCGWLQGTKMLLIENESPNYQKVPTDEERRRDKEKVVEVGLDMIEIKGSHCYKTFASIPPGQTARFLPADLASLGVRCQAGQTTYKVTLIPG